MTLSSITPANEAERLILLDLNLAEYHSDSISSLKDDLKDNSEAYGYTLDELNQFLFKYEIL